MRQENKFMNEMMSEIPASPESMGEKFPTLSEIINLDKLGASRQELIDKEINLLTELNAQDYANRQTFVQQGGKMTKKVSKKFTVKIFREGAKTAMADFFNFFSREVTDKVSQAYSRLIKMDVGEAELWKQKADKEEQALAPIFMSGVEEGVNRFMNEDDGDDEEEK